MPYQDEHVSELETQEEILDEGSNVVTKSAKPGEKMPKLEGGESAENIGGPDVKTYRPTDSESIGKKVAARMSHEGSKTLSTKPSSASGDEQDDIKKSPTFEEVEPEMTYDFNLDEDLEALVGGEDLTEEFKSKAKTIFEAVITTKLNEQLEVLHEQYAQVLEEEVEIFKAELAEKVDGYLTYVADQWMENNELAVENGIKEEISESFMTAIKSVFTQYNVEVPESQEILSELTDQLDIMESKLNEQIDKNVEFNKKLGGYIKNGIVAEVSVGLSEAQKEKLASLAEGVTFETESTFREKLSVLKESYFHKSPVATVGSVEETSTEEPVQSEYITESMSRYVTALGRWAK